MGCVLDERFLLLKKKSGLQRETVLEILRYDQPINC